MLEVSDVTLTAALSQVASVEGGLTEAETLANTAIAAAERFDLLEHPSVSEALTTLGQRPVRTRPTGSSRRFSRARDQAQ